MSIINREGQRVELDRPYPLRSAAIAYVGCDRVKRKVFAVRLLRESAGLTYAEIADTLNLSTGYVKRLDDRGKWECPLFFQPPPAA